MDTPFGSIPDRYGQLSMADAHEYLTARQISRRRLIRGAAVAAAGAWAGSSLLRAPARAAVAPAGIHLTYGADPGTAITVSWSTAEDVANPVLDLGLDAGFGRVVPAETRVVAGTATRYHHAVLTGLDPGQAYRYRVRHDGVIGPESTLTTAPPAATTGPFTFTAFGDQGVSAGGAATTARVVAQSPAFHLHAGDLCYAYSSGNGTAGPTDQAVWDRWFAQVSPLASRAPWMPAVGNHEMEVGYGPQGYGVIIDGGVRLPETATWSAVRYLDLSLLAIDVTPPAAGGVATMKLRALRPEGSLVEAITITRTRTPAGATGIASSGRAAGSGAAPGAAQVAARAAGSDDVLAATGAAAGASVVAGGALATAALALRSATRAGSGSGSS